MSKKIFKFVSKSETPVKGKLTIEKDFNEIYDQYITDKAKEQSSRCSQCHLLFVKFIAHYKTY